MQYTIYSALTSISSVDHGIKNMNVFYDTLFINFKTSVSGQYLEHVLIEKLIFDYETNEIKSDSAGRLICFGDTRNNEPNLTNGCVFVDNILFENKKEVLVCGLKAVTSTLTATVGNEMFQGRSFIPYVYSYNLNSDDLKLLYPSNQQLSSWQTYLMGTYVPNQTPLVSFNFDTNTLNYLVKSRLTPTAAPTAATVDVVNDISFHYNFDELTLTNVRQLSARRIGNTFVTYDYKKFRNYGDNKKLIVSANNDAVQVFTLI